MEERLTGLYSEASPLGSFLSVLPSNPTPTVEGVSQANASKTSENQDSENQDRRK